MSWQTSSNITQRPIPGWRSLVLAETADIDAWMRGGRKRRTVDDELIANLNRARRLRDEVQRAREDLHLRMEALRKEMAVLRAKRRNKHSG